MEKEYLIIDNHLSKNGNVTTELKESDGKLIVKQFSGTNTDNFIIKKFNNKRLEFSFFKLNGIYYININSFHIIDYKRFINIEHITKEDENVRIKNPFIGDILLLNCDVDIVYKALRIMADWMKNKKSIFRDFLYFLFH
jgi:hypothetical protein|uniref:Uncharacterized protein n=1 Tax=viral metagenome TaxID=1070528 RepID=A0A6C0AMH5_9ZZZZ